jgi:hypothetical protein
MKQMLRNLLMLATFFMVGANFMNAATFQLLDQETDIKGLIKQDAKSHFTLFNSGIDDAVIKIKITPVKLAEGHMFSICTPINCYPPQSAVYNVPDNFPVPAGDTITREELYLALINNNVDTNGVIGESELKIDFTNTKKLSDIVSLNIKYTISESGDVFESWDNVSASYPNPVTERASVKLTKPVSAPSVFNVYDSNGNKVSEMNINDGTQIINIDVNALSNGAYYYSVLSDGKQISGGNFVVSK